MGQHRQKRLRVRDHYIGPSEGRPQLHRQADEPGSRGYQRSAAQDNACRRWRRYATDLVATHIVMTADARAVARSEQFYLANPNRLHQILLGSEVKALVAQQAQGPRL